MKKKYCTDKFSFWVFWVLFFSKKMTSTSGFISNMYYIQFNLVLDILMNFQNIQVYRLFNCLESFILQQSKILFKIDHLPNISNFTNSSIFWSKTLLDGCCKLMHTIRIGTYLYRNQNFSKLTSLPLKIEPHIICKL